MTETQELHEKWMKDPAYVEAYEALAPEFELLRSVLNARLAAGLSQEELAERMQTSLSVVQRLEGGRSLPSTKTLKRFAAATGTRLQVTFQPQPNTKIA